MKKINSLFLAIVLITAFITPQSTAFAADSLTWDAKQDMPTARYNMGIAVSGGKIYAIGGDNFSCTSLTNIEEYDPATDTWNIRTSMLSGRWGLGVATAPDGKIYAIGGAGGNCGSTVLDTVEVYDPIADNWETRAAMPTPRWETRAATATNGKIYVFGGQNSNGWLATVEEYDPTTDTWSTKNNMPWANKNFAITASNNGKIYLLGGDADLSPLLEYDPANDTWLSRASNPSPRSGTGMVEAANGRIYVAGGDLGGLQSTVNSYDPNSDSWSAEANISIPRFGHGVTAVGNTIYVIGGWGGASPINSVEVGTLTALPQVLYAAPSGLTSGLCDSWANACDLQYALTSTIAGQEIWVASGVYKPGIDPTTTFQLKSGVALYGGFTGIETTIDQRDWQNNLTILSGDIEGDNSYHVVTSSGVDNTAMLDGFTITGGYAHGSEGGGMYNYDGSPTLTNIIFTANSAVFAGGGMYNGSGSPTLTNVTFSSNSAYYDAGGFYNNSGNPTLTNISFVSNSSNRSGAGMYNGTGNPTLQKILFYANSGDIGGGMYNNGGNPILTNVIFTSNHVQTWCGGMANISGSPILTNVTFYANSVAGYGGGGICNYGTPTLINSVLWGNSASFGSQIDGSISNITFSNVQGGWPGIGNIDADPLFVDAPNGDFHLQADSPAIDSGTNTGCPSTDFDGVVRPQDGNGDGVYTCDMGAYEVAGIPGTPPANDNFADATLINALPFSNAVDNTFATLETDEPLPTNCYSMQDTVWYAFTPAEAMVIRASVDGSAINTNLNVYLASGAGFSNLSFWGCNSTGYVPVVLTLEAGQTYYFQAGSIYGETGSVHINLEQIPPPANDYFANAEAITSLPFTATVDNGAATRELDEPDQCWGTSNTVWYSFTPSETMMVQADTNGSGLSASINIYRAIGSGITQLEPVPMTCTVYYNGIFLAEAGQTYYLQAGGQYPGQTGNIQVNFKQIIPPGNDNFANTQSITSLPVSVAVDVTGAGIESGEPSGCNSMTRTVWYSFTPIETMNIRINTAGSTIFTNVHVYQINGSGISDLGLLGCVAWGGSFNFTAMAGQTYYLQAGGDAGTIQFNMERFYPPANDNFNNPVAIGTLPFSNVVDITDATIQPDEPQYCYYSPKTVWYSFTPTTNILMQVDMSGSSFGDTTFTVYKATGPGLSGLSYMTCAYFGNSATFHVEAGTTYYIQAGSAYGSNGNLQLNLAELPRPSNDDFVNTKAITTLPFSDSQNITNAAIEPGEPQNCYYMSKTVWYSFTPTDNALVRADMQGSSFWDTNFTVYKSVGPGFNGLIYMTCAYFGNSATFTVEAGTTYYIQAGSVYGNNGNLQLNLVELPRPINDDFAKATMVSLPLPFDNTVDTQYASRQAGEPTPSCAGYGPGSRSVWYAFTPETSGSVSANISSAGFTPVIAVYTGNALNNLTTIGCQTYSNLLTFRANAGTTYYFQVDNYYPWEQGGSMQFHLDVAPRPVAGFYYSPFDPSVFDTIQFYDASYDPGQVGFQSFSWDFGDGTTSTSSYPTHKYVKDGDYTVQHSVTTIDGRTASIAQVVQVRTHDVAITKINAPQSASAKQTRTITVSVNSKNYAETVQVDLYKSVPGGFELVGSIILDIPTYSTNRTTAFNFNYTFTSIDASIGKVTFKAIATIINARDSYPSDNEAISSPPTKVSRGK